MTGRPAHQRGAKSQHLLEGIALTYYMVELREHPMWVGIGVRVIGGEAELLKGRVCSPDKDDLGV